jgi:CDP-glycerol glycerophosphotransferase
LPKAMTERLNGPGRKVLVVPTWQRERQTWLTSEEALRMLAETGMKKGITFFVKAHPTYFATVGNNTQEVGGLQLLHPGVDVYPILSKFDALVTDYSSIQFDFLYTKKPVLTLDLQPGEHTKFEPDWSLVPNVDFRYRFSAKDFQQRLDTALDADTLEAARSEMLSKIFETDPTRSCDALLHLIERLVKESQEDDFVVDYCGEPKLAQNTGETASESPASGGSLTDAA